jgi:hypothetical protein
MKMQKDGTHKENTEEENNGYVVFYLNIPGSRNRVMLREGRRYSTRPQ